MQPCTGWWPFSRSPAYARSPLLKSARENGLTPEETLYATNHLRGWKCLNLSSRRSADKFVKNEFIAMDIELYIINSTVTVPERLLSKYFKISGNKLVLTSGAVPTNIVRYIVSSYIKYPRSVVTRSNLSYNSLMLSKPDWLIKSNRDTIKGHKSYHDFKSVKKYTKLFIDNLKIKMMEEKKVAWTSGARRYYEISNSEEISELIQIGNEDGLRDYIESSNSIDPYPPYEDKGYRNL
jgi:hypothetical protein